MRILLENFFYKKDYFILTPRVYSFGGSMQSLSKGLKISISKNKKLIICVPLFNLHKKHKIKKLFTLDIILEIFKKLSFKEKLLTLIFSLFLNFNYILQIVKIRGLLKKVISVKFCDNYFPLTIGYDALDNNSYFECTSIEWKGILQTKINFSFKDKTNLFNKKNFVALYIKDKNYEIVSEISNKATAKITNFKESIDFLIKKNFDIIRTGDYLSEKFDYKSKNYLDITSSPDLSLKKQYKVFEKCEFILATNTPSIAIANFFDKKRVITNSPEQYSNNTASFSLENFSIFKKVFCLKKKKILSIEEILSNEYLFIEEISLFTDNKQYILIENNNFEILETCKEFIDFNYNNIKKDNHLLNQYLDLRTFAVEKLFKKSSSLTKLSSIKKYRYSKVSIPSFFLKKYLFNSKTLEEESRIVREKFGI